MADEERRELYREHTLNGVREEKVVETNPSTRNVLTSRINQLIWLLVVVLNGLLGLRFILRLIAANPNNAFADFIYDLTWLFVAPFATLTPTPATQEGMVFEVSTLIAMLVYLLAGWALTALIGIIFYDAGGKRRVTRIEQS